MKHGRWLALLGVIAAAILFLQYRSTPTKALPSKPNIIVIITDDQDQDAPKIMRKLMANPYGKWFQFTDGFAGDSIGGVARVSLLTGQYTFHHKILSNKNAGAMDDRNTLATWFQEQGYYTALIGKYLNGYPWGKGEGYFPRGWNHFEYFGHKDVDVYSDSTVALLTDVIDNTDQPFFLYLAHRAPQRPAEPPARYVNEDVLSIVQPATQRPNFAEADMSDKPAWARSQPIPKPGGYPGATINGYPGYMWDSNWIIDEQRRSLQQSMAIDDSLQRMLDLLDEKGELDNTVIFYLSDSGYSWGAHRRTGRGCPYEECSGVPYLVFYPNAVVPEGPTPYLVNRVVSNVDVTATIVDLAGLVPKRYPQDGTSLLPLLNSPNPNTAPWADKILLENLRGPIYYGIRTQDWKYVEYKTGERELYDLVNDPYEMQNLAANPLYKNKRVEMAAQLAALRNTSVYSISGRIVNPDGVGVVNVTVTAGTAKTTTAADGTYMLTGLEAGAKTLKAVKTGYTFSPTYMTLSVPPDATGKNFLATPKETYVMSGIIKRSGTGLAGVTVSDGMGRTAVTDATGRYTFGTSPKGIYTVTPSKAGLTFSPANITIEVPPGSLLLNYTATTAPTYDIGGVVKDELGAPVQGVTISDGNGHTATTDTAGMYNLTKLLEGTYTLLASKLGYSFGAIAPVTIPPGTTTANITAQTLYYSISGRVTGPGGAPLEGVVVADNKNHSDQTDADGNYALTGLKVGTYSLTAVKQGYSFLPVPLSVILTTADATGNDFSGTIQTYAITGRVADAGGTGVSGVVVSDGAGHMATTAATGNYSITGLLPGAYTLTAAKAGYIIAPSSLDIALGYQNATGNNFTATMIVYNAKGTIVDTEGQPLEGVTISDATGRSAVTGSDGAYTLPLPPGSHTLTPVKPGYSFDPPSQPVTLVDGDVALSDFTGTQLRYTISGAIKTAAGVAIPNVTITYGAGLTVTTDLNGDYSIPNLLPATFTLTPSLVEYTFSPASMQVVLGYASATGKNFTATLNTYTVSGLVTDATGAALGGVTISDGNGRTAVSNSTGAYTLTGLPKGTYTLTASRAGYTFTTLAPVSVGPNKSGQNFVGTLIVYDISGQVLDTGGNAVAGVTITYASGKSVLTDSNGQFLINDVVPKTYTLTPSKQGYSFSPTTTQVVLSTGDVTGVSFTATQLTYSISGVIRTPAGAALPGVTVSYGTGLSVVTNSFGQYTISGLLPGTFVLTPSLAEYTFTPASLTVSLGFANSTGRNFTGTLITYSVSGTVLDQTGAALSGVTISDGNGRSATTNSAGVYILSGLPKGTYTLTAAKAGYTFTTLAPVDVGPSQTGADFTGTLIVYDIRGAVATTGGAPMQGVTITYATGKSVTTDSNGEFWINDIVPGTYTLTPSFLGYSFSPASTQVVLSNADVTGVTFAGTQLFYSISGLVRTPSGVALPGVTVTYGDGLSVVTNSSGQYIISGLLPATFTLTPSLTEYTFSPTSMQVVLGYASVTGKNFTGTLNTYAVSGTVIDQTGAALPGVTISDGAGRTATSGLNGGYTLNLPAGTYTLTAAKAGYTFTTRDPITVGPGISGQDFTGTLIVWDISGAVVDSNGSAMAGVTVTYATGKSVTTDSNGQFLIDDIVPGSYTVTPSLPGYSFSPASTPVNLTADVSGLAFTGTRLTYLIRGLIATSGGVKIPGVTVTYGDGLSVTTDTAGIFTIQGLYPGTYTLTPSLTDYLFTPASLQVVLGFANSTANNFTGTYITYAVTGVVRDSFGSLMSGVTIADGTGRTTTSNTSGAYTLNLPAGTYTLTATKPGYTFNTIAGLTVPPAQSNQNFTGSVVTYEIRGTIRNIYGGGIPNIPIFYGNGRSVLTDSDGDYVIAGLTPGLVTVKPTLTGFTFTPVKYDVTISSSSVTGRDFTASAATRTIRGTITDWAGTPLEGVAVGNGSGLYVYTDVWGAYTMPSLLPGSYTLTPALPGYTFTPATAAVPLTTADVTQNFLGQAP